MPLIDLSLPAPGIENDKPTCRLEEWDIRQGPYAYTGLVYRFDHWSMTSTYIDFPGHIKETDDGSDADNYPLERLFRVEASVIHLDREDGAGRVDADELRRAFPDGPTGGALILNALGRRRFDAIAERSVYLGKDAVEWIVGLGVHLFVSDIYESDDDPQNVFYDLFANGVSTVCFPINLHLIAAPRVRVTALPLRFPGATQLPCRAIAEWEDE